MFGIGLTLYNDVMGPRNLTGAYGNFAYILKLNNKYKLSFGLSAGLNRYAFNFNKLTYKQNENTIDFSQVQTFNSFDVNSGLYFRSNSFFIGLSNTHLFASDVFKIETGNNSFLSYRLRTHNFLSIGKSFLINENFIVVVVFNSDKVFKFFEIEITKPSIVVIIGWKKHKIMFVL